MQRTIVFDAVGTLIHPVPGVATIYQTAGMRHGYKLDVSQIRQRFHQARPKHFLNDLQTEHPTDEADQRNRWRNLIDEVFGGGPAINDLFLDLWQTFSQAKCWGLFPDVAATIKVLAQSGFDLAIASNFDSRLGSILEGIAELGTIPNVFTSAAIGFAKPSRNFFDQVRTSLNLDCEQLVMVGDDPVCDFDGSANAGWKQILIARNGDPALRRPAIAKLTDLPDWLESN